MGLVNCVSQGLGPSLQGCPRGQNIYILYYYYYLFFYQTTGALSQQVTNCHYRGKSTIKGCYATRSFQKRKMHPTP